jgi:hypothetical protein
MSVSAASSAVQSFNPYAAATKPQAAPTPKPAAAAPASAPVDSDGDHDGTVGTKIDVKA